MTSTGLRPRPDDEELALARRFVAGDERALRGAYDRWGGLVHAFCARSLASRADAEEATAQVFVNAWRGRSGFDPERGSLASWLIGIARRAVADAHSRTVREQALRAAVTCCILAKAGPQRSRILANLYKDERTAHLDVFPFMERVYLERILRPDEVGTQASVLPLTRLVAGACIGGRELEAYQMAVLPLVKDLSFMC